MTLEHTLGHIGRQIDTGIQKTTEVIRSINLKHPLRAALGGVLIWGGMQAYSQFVSSNGIEQVSTAPVTRLTPKDLATPVVEITPTIDGQTQHILVFAESSPTEQPIPTPLFTDLLTPTVTGTPTASPLTYDGENTNIARAGDSKICATTAEAITFLQQNDLFMDSLKTVVKGKKIAEIKVGDVGPWAGKDGSIKMAYRQGNQVNWENVYISHDISTTNVAAKSYSADQELFRKYIVVTEDKDGKKNAAEIEVQADCRCGNGVQAEVVPSPTITFTETSTATATSVPANTPENTAVNTPKPPAPPTQPAPTEIPTATPTKPREASSTPQTNPEKPTPTATPTKPREASSTPQTNPEEPTPTKEPVKNPTTVPATSIPVVPTREPSSTPQTNPEKPTVIPATSVPPTKEPVKNPTTVPATSIPATSVPVVPTAVPTSTGREPTQVPSK